MKEIKSSTTKSRILTKSTVENEENHEVVEVREDEDTILILLLQLRRKDKKFMMLRGPGPLVQSLAVLLFLTPNFCPL